MTGEDRTPIEVAAGLRSEERMGEISPDGRWVVYDTDESGRFEIKVQAFPTPTREAQVSINGGVAPRWSGDGSEVFFVAPDGTMMASRFRTTDSAFEAEPPVPLFPTEIVSNPFNHNYAVTSDRRFLIRNRQAEASSSPIVLLLNWMP